MNILNPFNLFKKTNSTTVQSQPETIFLMGGRTGGPLLPVLAIARGLEEFVPIVIGVKNSFEERYCREEKLPFETLPEAKLTLLSFKNLSFKESLIELWNTLLMLFKLLLSFGYCIGLIIRYKPKLIITAGSFLAVPMAYASIFCKCLMVSKAKLVVHQQDVTPSLSNKLVVPFASQVTYVFEDTKKYLKDYLTRAYKIFNPVDFYRFSDENINSLVLEQGLELFLNPQNMSVKAKPIMLIFGGGSGSQAINQWVSDNLDQLLEKFKVLHLTGALQDDSFSIAARDGYLSYQMLSDTMPVALIKASFVVARAGLATITELQYLQKPAFLIPLPNSHQEANAQSVAKLFPTLAQDKMSSWIQTIDSNYPDYFKNVVYPDKKEIFRSFEEYIYNLRALL
jgi:UDP-N-acetylglucosamine--N-acetylmuramyl-(pentapeptide) pyrophosphoryl-undecaprenol N-acetylglucosamine transferase